MATGSKTDAITNPISVAPSSGPVQRVLVPVASNDVGHQMLPLLRGFFAIGEVELVLFGVDAALQMLESTAEELREAGYAVQIVTVENDAARSIVTYVNTAGIDMIALASLSRAGSERSTGISERVLRSVNVPVLLLRPPS